MPPIVVLVGPMGAGKSSVGRALARQLQVKFRDTDRDVEIAAGKPVSEIFVDLGEAEFRKLEKTAVARALRDHPGVLALGGGAVLAVETRELLTQHPVVYLEVGLTDAVKRVGLGVSRPLLVGNVRATLKNLLAERSPIYESVADYQVSTDGRSLADVAVEIADYLAQKA